MSIRPRHLSWMAFLALVQPVLSQQLVPKLRVRKITFATPKAVLGLPTEVRHISGLCAGDGLTYYDTGAGSATPADLFSLSPTAEVKHFRRKLPIGFNELTVKNFYPFELGVITLLEANKRDDPKSKPTATEYFLSTSDHDGDQGDLLSLSLRFKPLRIAAFASGDFLVLGWDTANQLPLLAMLKPDGGVRRFVDLGDMQRPGTSAAANAGLSFHVQCCMPIVKALRETIVTDGWTSTAKTVRRVMLSAILVGALGAAAPTPPVTTIDAAGNMVLGSPSAHVTVTEYASLGCPHCAKWARTVYPAFKAKYVDTGRVRFEFHELLTGNAAMAAAGFLTARCAGKDHYFQVVDAVFLKQNELAGQGAPVLSRSPRTPA